MKNLLWKKKENEHIMLFKEFRKSQINLLQSETVKPQN